jgi:hypothetical protein
MTGHPSGAPVVTASLMLHLYPDVPLRVSLHPDEDRAVVAIGTGTLLLSLFCDHAELVALRDTLTAAVTDLDTTRQTINNDTAGGDATTGISDTGETAPVDEVRTPAA